VVSAHRYLPSSDGSSRAAAPVPCAQRGAALTFINSRANVPDPVNSCIPVKCTQPRIALCKVRSHLAMQGAMGTDVGVAIEASGNHAQT
jgi:hypothetical protein